MFTQLADFGETIKSHEWKGQDGDGHYLAPELLNKAEQEMLV